MKINSLQQNNEIVEIKKKIDGLIDLFYPVGSFYETTDEKFNPNTSWGGTWKKDNSGVFLVSEDSSLTLGETGGEKTHQLTLNEMPQHSHAMLDDAGNIIKPAVMAKTAGGSGYEMSQITSGNRLYVNLYLMQNGGSEEHNNMPPYLVVARWHRIS